MVSIGPTTIASSLFGLALLALSAAEDAKTGWSSVDLESITEADYDLLYKAWGNNSAYAPGVTTYGWGTSIFGLGTKNASMAEGSKAGTATDYHFSVNGCTLKPDQTELVGECDDMECTFINYAAYEVYITSDPQSNTLKVTAITAKSEP
ncbi:hypothetical protein PHYSODRAFT_258081 [Phytophthora sojae]|uniref:Uncharacterized protein n=1 Tax=Phytophthora sojae (strain P6497) TaxID=1094619 RepID=G4YZX5_PHYSP|nr:hypothetical protein PHYSODRAFT_258081 [Phytophthora sojae]EGZ23338.1 hypothetical protein PHYSODRAFT_258081 [Phytophthora sojae]|eukprot:XP_009518626.1 hypothetical protein PHYSODRAFT_258081 [Phytophthora sojae]